MDRGGKVGWKREEKGDFQREWIDPIRSPQERRWKVHEWCTDTTPARCGVVHATNETRCNR